MSKSLERGKIGESYVCEYLENKGYQIICTNYHSRYGEIDIICENDKYIVFVEVKTRKNFSFSRAIEAVNKSKRLKIIKTALIYLSEINIDKQPRFDVAEVLINSHGELVEICYHENCFDVEELNAFF